MRVAEESFRCGRREVHYGRRGWHNVADFEEQLESVGLDIITRNMRTAGMTRERFFELLQRC